MKSLDLPGGFRRFTVPSTVNPSRPFLPTDFIPAVPWHPYPLPFPSPRPDATRHFSSHLRRSHPAERRSCLRRRRRRQRAATALRDPSSLPDVAPPPLRPTSRRRRFDRRRAAAADAAMLQLHPVRLHLMTRSACTSDGAPPFFTDLPSRRCAAPARVPQPGETLAAHHVRAALPCRLQPTPPSFGLAGPARRRCPLHAHRRHARCPRVRTSFIFACLAPAQIDSILMNPHALVFSLRPPRVPFTCYGHLAKQEV